MKARINDVIVKYIECINCSYEKSYPLPKVSSGNRFNWLCPECQTSLSGVIEQDGTVRVMFDAERVATEEYILVEKSKELVPWIMVAQKRCKDELEEQSVDSSTTLYLFPVESNKAENPWGLPVFRAISHNP